MQHVNNVNCCGKAIKMIFHDIVILTSVISVYINDAPDLTDVQSPKGRTETGPTLAQGRGPGVGIQQPVVNHNSLVQCTSALNTYTVATKHF